MFVSSIWVEGRRRCLAMGSNGAGDFRQDLFEKGTRRILVARASLHISPIAALVRETTGLFAALSQCEPVDLSSWCRLHGSRRAASSSVSRLGDTPRRG